MSFVSQVATRRKPIIPLNNLSTVTPEQAQTILDRFVCKLHALPNDAVVSPNVYERTLTSIEIEAPQLSKILGVLQTVATNSRPLDASDRKLLDNAQQTINAHFDMDREADTLASTLKSVLFGVMKPGRSMHQHAQKAVAELSR